MSKQYLCFALAFPALLAANPAAGDDAVEAVVVTATRTPLPAGKTGESISVITGAQIDTQQILSVTDILGETPGIELVRNGGIGQTATVSIRGAEAGQTLVLVDGVRLNDPSTVDNEAVLGDLLVNNIDRIEILRGPQSTLYGSDAIGGVINVLTRRGGDDPFSLRTSVEGGSFDTYRVNAAANGRIDPLEYGAALNFLHSNGISAADSRNRNPETDGYTNVGATENVRLHLAPGLSLDLRSYYTNARVDFDDSFAFVPPETFRVADSAAYARNSLLAAYAGLNFDLFGGAFANRIAAIGSQSKRAFYDSAFDAIHKNFSDDGEARRVEYQGIVQFSPEDQLTFGAEYQRISFEGKTLSSFAPPAADRGHSHVTSVYAQYLTTLFDQLTLSAGIRRDDDQEFGDHISLKAAAAWSLNDGSTILHANYGDGFKAPTLFEQFSEFSNPLHALAPEMARGWEAGMDQTLLDGRAVARVTYFDRHTEDQIDFLIPDCVADPDICKIRPFGYYENIKRASANGVEIEATIRVTDALTLNSALTRMTASDLTTGLDLARRPHITASATATWVPAGDWSAGATVIYTGRRFDSAGEAHPLASNAVVNVFGAHKLNESFELFARIENLFGARYEPVFGYGAAGRAGYIGIRASY